jgi:hypothetical protein
MNSERDEILRQIDQLFGELITHQRGKVFADARKLRANFTDDDIAQPHDFAELRDNPMWQYEDGILAGYQAAHMALRAQLR